VSISQLEAARSSLDATDFLRASHVVPENTRPVELAKAFAHDDLALAGRLMNDSHASLRDLYAVSCEELDLITEIARRQPSCYGARMTGAGFGGCAVALVDASAVEAFAAAVLPAYRTKLDLPAALYACRPEAGARLVE